MAKQKKEHNYTNDLYRDSEFAQQRVSEIPFAELSGDRWIKERGSGEETDKTECQ
jgi:hypothetical protein